MIRIIWMCGRIWLLKGFKYYRDDIQKNPDQNIKRCQISKSVVNPRNIKMYF